MTGTSGGPRPARGRAVASSPWIVVFTGVVVMVVLLVIALSTYRGRSPDAEVPLVANGAPVPTPPWPSASSTEPATAGPTGGSPRSPSPTPERSTSSPTPTARSASPTASPAATRSSAPRPQASTSPSAAPAVTGRYAVTGSFNGGFIGEVHVVNSSRAPQDWEVRLAFSGGGLVRAWVANAPQGTLRESGGGYTYTGDTALAPGTSVRLMFHVERADEDPVTCTVNGVTCVRS
ncbi:cellulose binding domain-containing protein [Micromonospora globbae]|uniref:Cellulose-binding protein n=1 Tax=Micromonospora globbae TaxID=1894969 RepID=A0A420ENQ9_9ACTN|nr:cellulose binding domain-containing protein [Micromonospora globbae]RKF22320.1 cellulose-binding protein [Micromonospora globbae]